MQPACFHLPHSKTLICQEGISKHRKLDEVQQFFQRFGDVEHLELGIPMLEHRCVSVAGMKGSFVWGLSPSFTRSDMGHSPALGTPNLNGVCEVSTRTRFSNPGQEVHHFH